MTGLGEERHDSGFTLVELLVVITLETLIVGSLGFAFVAVLNGSTSVRQSLSRSGDARIAAAYIVNDARNSSGPETALADTASCPDPSPPVAGIAGPVVRFSFDTTGSAGATTPTIVNYVLVANALLRRQCDAGALVSDSVVAQTVASVSAACAPSADCSGAPTSITATITETPDSAGAVFTYSLTGAFRKALAVGSALTAPGSPSLMTLGGACGPAATGIRQSGTTRIRVYGRTFVNAPDGSTCPAMNLSDSATFRSGKTGILLGGSCTASGAAVCPAATSYSPPKPDPYSGRTAPSPNGLTGRSGCPGGTAQPGVYAAPLSLAGTACQFSSGVYIFQNGLNLTGGAALTNAAGGVLVYLTGGAFTVADTASVTLSAPTAGAYAGIGVWQSPGDTAGLTFSSSGAVAISGAIYAPSAQLNASGAAISASPVVVQTIVMTLGATMTVGSPSSTPLSIGALSPPTAWTVNRPFPTATLTASGGDGAYGWSLAGAPAGMTIDPVTGTLSGTPTATGPFSLTVTLSDDLGDDTASVVYSLTINAAPTISTASLPAGNSSVPYTATVNGAGGTTAYAWSATGLPAGLAINATTGIISGTPTASGTSTVAVTLTDAAGATVTKSLALAVTAALPTIVSVALVNGGATTGRLEKSNKISITFSAQMKVSSLCSAWSGDTSNQIINADNNVTVAVSSGATNVITVTSTSCTFQFGSLNLGSGGYVSAPTTFSGAAGNASTITWTASTRTLTISLGALKTGAVAAVASSTPVYTAAVGVVDSTGTALSNSPFTLPTGRQF